MHEQLSKQSLFDFTSWCFNIGSNIFVMRLQVRPSISLNTIRQIEKSVRKQTRAKCGFQEPVSFVLRRLWSVPGNVSRESVYTENKILSLMCFFVEQLRK